jgi:hypothetical protein
MQVVFLYIVAEGVAQTGGEWIHFFVDVVPQTADKSTSDYAPPPIIYEMDEHKLVKMDIRRSVIDYMRL